MKKLLWGLAAFASSIALIATAGSARLYASGPLLDDIGPAWTLVTCQPSQLAGPIVCFQASRGASPRDFLIMSAPMLASGVDPRALVVAEGPSGGESFDTPGLDVARGSVVGSGDRVLVTITMAAGDRVYHLVLDSAAPPGEAEASLLDVARRQQAAVGRPPATGSGTDGAAARALDRLLLTPPSGSGLAVMATIDVPSDVRDLRAVARSQAVVDLVARAPARTRILSAGGVPLVSVTLWEQPYDVFAAAELGTFAGRAPDRSLTVELDRLPNAVGFRLPAGSDKGLAIVFRKGRYVAFVIAPAVGTDEGAAARALVELAVLQANLLPTGASAPYFFPSTARSIAVAVAATTVLCGVALGIGPLAATRRRRRPTVTTARGGDAEDDVIDVTASGAALRRRGLVLVVADIVAVNAVIVGTLGMTGVLRLPPVLTVTLVVAGALGGTLFTLWWARSERRSVRHVDASAGELRPSMLGVIGGAVAITLLVIGLAIVATGLANLAFGPSLSALQRSQLLGVDPAVLNLGALVVGVVLLVLGGFALRLARMWSRSDARRLRARDERPPILYLRSFEDDALRLPIVVSARRPFLELFAARGSDLFEESIAWQVAPYGPVVAVGRPGRPVQSLGAARELLADDVWHERVREQMAAARAIVVTIGATDGLRWEIAQLVAGDHLNKTVFVFPPATGDVLRGRWRFTDQALVSSGAEVPGLPADAGSVLVALLDRPGSWRVAVAGIRDEATYRVALDRAMSLLTADIGDAIAVTTDTAPATRVVAERYDPSARGTARPGV